MKRRQIRSIFVPSTPEDTARHEAQLRDVEKDLPELMDWARRSFRAIEEPTFSGELRRAIIACDLEREELISRIGITDELLNDFMGGDASLPSAALDKLVDLLGYRLTKTG